MDEKDREILERYERLNKEVKDFHIKFLNTNPTLEEINHNTGLKNEIAKLQPERDRIMRERAKK
jgi:hypothetical protein